MPTSPSDLPSARPGPESVTPDARRQEDFLTALGRDLDVRLVVLVPTARVPRWWWLGAEPSEADEVARVSGLGRNWLQDTAAPTELLDDDTLAVVGIRTDDGRLCAALVAAKRPGARWTAEERALLAFSATFCRSDLVALADRPRPRPDLAIGPDSSHELEERMRTAAERGELSLEYQPEIDMRTGTILAVEALVRWDHPEQGRLGPDTFIAVAERSDLIKILGSWVIERSLREYASWRGGMADGVVLRVNVSPAQLAGDGIVEQLGAGLHENGLRGDQLCIELTETSTFGDIDDLSLTLRSLTDMGIGSAIDDLATGYSTLSRLRVLPVDTIKIDRSLVSGLDQDARARAIVAALIGLAAELDLDVVGEGIETSGEARALLDLGCARGQGHFFARPDSGAATGKLLETGRISIDGLAGDQS